MHPSASPPLPLKIEVYFQTFFFLKKTNNPEMVVNAYMNSWTFNRTMRLSIPINFSLSSTATAFCFVFLSPPPHPNASSSISPIRLFMIMSELGNDHLCWWWRFHVTARGFWWRVGIGLPLTKFKASREPGAVRCWNESSQIAAFWHYSHFSNHFQ